ncbi:taste receptor type 1 member 1 isoform X2 [Dromaius novaehollandiae]|uniref:taste receptor type 1 member 1 isoform X2 n=1 Tax=Dromaius novaehollandiae TaxID=8790 RepID=UPI00311E9BE5
MSLCTMQSRSPIHPSKHFKPLHVRAEQGAAKRAEQLAENMQCVHLLPDSGPGGVYQQRSGSCFRHLAKPPRIFPFTPAIRLCLCSASTFRSHGYYLFQAMRFTVEEINNSSTLLPNVTLGYEIYDTCSESANTYATLRALAQKGQHSIEMLRAFQRYESRAVAVIGPDSTKLALTTAAILSLFLVPEISYEASLETLSLKQLYPSFLRTIPSDRQQVKAIMLLLQRFGWTWVALLGSDNAYGRSGMEALHELLSAGDICVAYQGIIPADKDASSPELRHMVRILTDSRVNVTIVFSSKQIAHPFFEVVVQENITGMVWVGTEDWSLAQTIWHMPGIQSIGTVIGMSIKQTESVLLKHFESWKNAEESASGAGAGRGSGGSSRECAELNCTQGCTGCSLLTTTPDEYDTKASYSVYTAVYAVAHGLHSLLGCASGACSKGRVYPWQLLEKIKQVNFSLHENQISFDANGDILKGYDIMMWNWRGPSWSSEVVGSFSVSPDRLSIDQDKILWHTEDNQVPVSVCSEPCQAGEKRLQQGRHRCCFSCVACPAGTFLNRTDLYACQACGRDEWAPASSEACFNRTTDFLSWADPLSWALLTLIALLMLLMAGLAVVFALNISTPVVKSAGGKMCFIMLGALACACSSLFCYFGEPTWLTCLLRLPLFSISFTVVLSCITTRSFQVVCIFKLNRKWPALYEAWMRHRGPALFIGGSTAAQAALCLLWVSARPPVPSRNYGVSAEQVVLECSQDGSQGATAVVAYNVLLSACCFALSYLGRGLPENYNEAKSVTLCLLLHFACSACVLAARRTHQGRSQLAATLLNMLCTVAALLGGYFLPKAYVVLLRPELNTAAHFQMSIQRYTLRPPP